MEAEIRRLFEETRMTVQEIATLFNITKSTVSGLAYRRGWISYNSQSGRGIAIEHQEDIPIPTLHQRLDALNHQMDQQLGLDDSGWWDGRKWWPGKPRDLGL